MTAAFQRAVELMGPGGTGGVGGVGGCAPALAALLSCTRAPPGGCRVGCAPHPAVLTGRLGGREGAGGTSAALRVLGKCTGPGPLPWTEGHTELLVVLGRVLAAHWGWRAKLAPGPRSSRDTQLIWDAAKERPRQAQPGRRQEPGSGTDCWLCTHRTHCSVESTAHSRGVSWGCWTLWPGALRGLGGDSLLGLASRRAHVWGRPSSGTGRPARSARGLVSAPLQRPVCSLALRGAARQVCARQGSLLPSAPSAGASARSCAELGPGECL